MGRTRNSVSGFVLMMALAGLNPALASEGKSAFAPDEHPETRQLLEELSAQGIPETWLREAFDTAEYRQSVLDAMEGAAERRLRWFEYRDIFISDERIAQGAEFIKTHQDAFERAEQTYGVPAEIIAAIIGVETYYGRYKGDHRVLDSLATLAFHHPTRGAFFRGELAAFLDITYEQQVAPESVYGSYAGAMGYPQFIPTSYDAYAVDFDGDGRRDLWENPVDAIGSVAHYFAEHRWQPGAPVYHEAQASGDALDTLTFNQTSTPETTAGEAAEAGLVPADTELEASRGVVPLKLELANGDTRYGLGEYNFYVITRYNHSHLYAMAVVELAEAIAHTLEGQG
ncbi:lytic murein transglycosylase B [Vreelandella sp. TE19]